MGIAGHRRPPNPAVPVRLAGRPARHARRPAMPRKSKSQDRIAVTRLLQGIAKHFTDGLPVVLGGKSYTPAELAAVFQAHLDAIDAVTTARAQLATAILRRRGAARRAGEATRLLKLRVAGTDGFSATVWADFGWQVPKKPGPKTVMAKVVGAAKARATREARGTLGKRARKKVRT